jgi:signal transduction histidine kinase
VRFVRSSGRRRDEVRAALFGLAAAPAVVAVACIGLRFEAMAVVHFMAPLLVAMIPVSIGVSLIRHNVLEWHAVATTRLVLPPVFVLAAVAAVLAFLVVNQAAHPPANHTALAATASGVAFLGAFVTLRRAGLRRYFPSTSAFRPTIEQLSDELREAAGRDEVVRAIIHVIERRLAISASISDPCGVREELSTEQWEELLRGESVFTAGAPSVRSLLVPLRSSGELRAVLRCSPKPSGALYLREDIALLETIAGVGALALHNAEVMEALNRMRRLQVGAAEQEKRLAISALAAELSHEINHSLIFFRYLLADADDRPLVPDDVTIGRNEVARLQRTLGHLRRLDIPPSAMSAVPLLGTIRHAEALVRDVIQTKSLSVHVSVPKDLEVIAAPDPLLQVFSNLLRNAAQAAPERGNLGVEVRPDETDLVIDVWDDGPGVPDGLERRIFQPWVTMTEGGTGLGLAVAQRIVASFGWKISVRRVEERTYFTIRAHRTALRGPASEAKE